VVRFPGSADRNALSQLGRQVDQPVPTGSVMLAEQAGRVIAAVSLDGGAALAEPTPEAESAVAVLRFRIHQLRHGAFGAGVTGHRRTMAAA